MKYFARFFVCFLLLVFNSCDKDKVPTEEYLVAVPITQSLKDFRSSVKIQEPQEIEQSGKIYAYGDYIYVNDRLKGVHIIENKNFSPKKIKYLKIPQNTDIAIKDDILYANSGMDLVTFDISDIDNIKKMQRLENVFPTPWPDFPPEAQSSDYSNFDDSKEIVIGYNLETRIREVQPVLESEMGIPDFAESGDSGIGGSLARFNLSGSYLYVVDNSELNVFDIGNVSNPQKISTEYVGWQIETIFNQEGYLYLGSAGGLFIYSLETPGKPTYVSAIQHIWGCDPVVVKNNLAYVTIRGGNTCGQELNQLEVIDVSDRANPQSLKIYEMENPYGVGVKDNYLFVCDGDSGLKIFDTSNSPELVLKDHFEGVNSYDVIPLENVLLMVGNNSISQYSYKNNKITLLSSFALD